MPRLWADKWMRVGSGLGLLLLAVASEKVCPWLHAPSADPGTPPAESGPSANPAQGPLADASGPRKPPDKRQRAMLPQIIPDAPAPRWPVVWGQALARETTGARDGVLAHGPREVDAPLVLVDVSSTPAWHRFLLDLAPLALAAQAPARTPAAVAILTALCPTGPPQS